MRIRLAKEDGERLGAPDWIPWPPTGLYQIEAEVLQEDLGVEPDEFYDWLRRQPQPVKSVRFRVWQALRRAGVNIAFAAVDFDRNALEVEDDAEEPAAEPGKDDLPFDPTTPSDS